jgi:hypothetical protein
MGGLLSGHALMEGTIVVSSINAIPSHEYGQAAFAV